jgi:hypothetical protein
MSRSCWGCYYEKNSVCHWFKLAQKSAPKVIPSEVLPKGCSKYSNKASAGNSELAHKLIKKFDGELIGDKYTPFVNYKRKKRKYVKSSHNYAYRKDAQ